MLLTKRRPGFFSWMKVFTPWTGMSSVDSLPPAQHHASFPKRKTACDCESETRTMSLIFSVGDGGAERATACQFARQILTALSCAGPQWQQDGKARQPTARAHLWASVLASGADSRGATSQDLPPCPSKSPRQPA